MWWWESVSALHNTFGTHQQEVVILWFCPQIFEDRLLPVPLHIVPVINLPMSYRIANAVSWGFRVGDGLVADKEVEIFHSAF